MVDANYLRQERLFRHLYDEARQERVDAYSMDTRAFRAVGSCRWRSVIKSWSVSLFYGFLVIGGIAAAAIAYFMC